VLEAKLDVIQPVSVPYRQGQVKPLIRAASHQQWSFTLDRAGLPNVQSLPNGIYFVAKNPPKSPPKKPSLATLLEWLAAVLVLAVAAGLVIAQAAASGFFVSPSYDPMAGINPNSVGGLAKRIPLLQSASDPVQRDSYCIPLSAYGRALDRALPPDARVFMGGMIGPTNGGHLGYYYFLRNQLFPRKVDISLDGHAVFKEGEFDGVPCDSPEELQKHGFDLLIAQGQNGMQLIPLSQKGMIK
jgi:hypothetical protein